MHSLTLELSHGRSSKITPSLSHLLSHVRSFKITGTKVVGSLMFVQGPIHLYYKPDLGCTIRTLCMCNSSEVVITETHFHPQMEHQRWMSPISTPLTFMWLDACMRMTDGKKMMSAFFGRYNLQYPPLFVFELHRIRSGWMINIETRASILLIHL